MNIALDLLKQERVTDLYILCRFMYRIGKPILDDKYYDTIEQRIKDAGLMQEYTSRTYDDDPVPYELLVEFNLTSEIPDMGTTSKYSKYLDEEKSLSIQPFTKYRDIFNFTMEKREDMIFMLKVDGINVKQLYIKDNMELSMSRGRNGQGFDLTKNVVKVAPCKLNTEREEVKVFSEYFVYESQLDYLRDKYGKDKYKTPKSSAISMLRVEHEKEDYKCLNGLAFHIEGVETLETKQEMLQYLQDLGFSVVPHLVVKWENIPQTFDEFVKWLEKICGIFYKETEALPSDGLVLEVNRLNYSENVNNQYSNRNIAIKLSYWSFGKYRAVVEDIMIEQQRVKASCRVKIKPLRTKDGCNATVVNVYNPRILIENNINIGSEIVFERNSGAINSLVYGSKLIE